jgi:uncharacterized membrane protein
MSRITGRSFCRKARAGIFALLVGASLAATPAQAANNDVSESVTVKAPVDVVWKVISSADNFDADVKSVKEEHTLVEQSFSKIPFYGEVKATIEVKAKENESLSYRMVDGKNIKNFSGCWTLSPIDKTTTRLKLTSNIDPALPIPRFLVNQFIRGKVRGRLKKSQTLAETMYVKNTKTTCDLPKQDLAK